MRTIFPIAVNLVFGLCILGIIIIPLELNLPTRMLITFYIVSILMLILIFGLTYTIIDMRNILLDIDKNIKNIRYTSHDLPENTTEASKSATEEQINDNNKEVNRVQEINEEGKSNANEKRLICPFCGADYSEYPYATACFNCHKFFDSNKK